MSLITVAIEEFPKDGKPWRIDGLGRLYNTGSSSSEPLIDVHLSQLHPEYEDPLKNESLAGPSRRIPIKVGFIPVLKNGSVWKNRVRFLPNRNPKQLNFHVTAEQIELHNWGSTIEFESRRINLIGSKQFFVPRDNWQDLSQSWVVVIRRPIPSVPYLVIPSSVIFQKCFAESPHGIRRLLRGELNQIIDNPSPVESDDGISTYFVELSKNINTSRAHIYANLAADSVGKYEYERLCRTLVTASANEDRSGTKKSQSYLKIGLPFSNKMSIRVCGKPMRLYKSAFDIDREFAFLATEIVNLDVRLAFDRLIVYRKNNADKGQNSEDAELKDAWVRPKSTSVDLRDGALVGARSDEEPISDLEKLIAEEAGGFNATDLEVIKAPKLVQKYRSRMLAERLGVTFSGATTTGDTRSGNRGAAELNISTSEAPRVPGTLTNFFETLQILRNAGHAVATRAVAGLHRFNDVGDVVNFFPRNIQGVRSWHLSDDQVTSRGYVIATIQSGGVWHHLIELECKGEESRSLACIRAADGALIEAPQLRSFMIDVVRERGWNAVALRPNWNLSTINHSPKKGIQHFARAIAKAVGVTL